MSKTTWLMIGVLVLGLFFLLWDPLWHYNRVDTAAGNFLLPVQYKKSLRAEIKYIPGPDKKWFTKDDRIYGYYLYEFNSQGLPVSKECFRFKPKTFHAAHTKELFEYWKYEYDARGLLFQERHFVHPGRDKKWYTFDDVESEYTRNVFDFSGRKRKEIKYGLQGQVVSHMSFKHDAKNRIIEDREYGNAGDDGEWLTGDDVLAKYHIFEYAKNGAVCKVKEFTLQDGGAGIDTQWGTDDDAVNAVKIYFYNPDGSLREDRKYVGAGKDGVWFTDDDTMQYYTRYEYAGGAQP